VRFALRSSRLRRLIAAYTVNRLGTWIGFVALTVAVYDHTHSALAVAVTLLAGQGLPAFAVPSLVARVEASKRRDELSALLLFEAVATGGVVVFIWQFSLPAILVLVALDGTAALAASALLRTEVARVAREHASGDGEADGEAAPVGAAWPPAGMGAGESPAAPGVPSDPELALESREADALTTKGHESPAEAGERAGNAALNVAFAATFVTGPVLAGVLVAAAGAPVALLLDVVSFLICGALLIHLHPHVEESGSETVAARLRVAWKYITETRTLRQLLLLEMVAFVFFETAAPIEVSFAKATLGAGDRGFGVLLTTWGAGTVLGSIVFARAMNRSLGYLLSAGTLAVGLAYAGFAFASTLPLACVAAFVGGVGNGVELPSMFSLVQRLTPPNLHGRLMGAVESISALCPIIGLPLGGALVVLTTPRTAFLIVGTGTIAAALALLRAVRHVGGSAQQLEAETPGASAPPELQAK
jgi:predicted MFS family arabinose efflux permease